MMREEDLPGKAAGLLAGVRWVKLHFAKYVPCNTGSTGCVMVLRQNGCILRKVCEMST